MSIQTSRPTFSAAQRAFLAAADLQAALYNDLKGQFEAHATLFPLSGQNSLGFTRAQMLTGLGGDAAEFTQTKKRLLQIIADIMPNFIGDVWAQGSLIRPWFATLSVTIPSGF